MAKTRKNGAQKYSGFFTVKTSKFGAHKTTLDGITFDSAREATRWAELKLMEKHGLIADLRRQVDFELIPNQYEKDGGKKRRLLERACRYKADFVYKQNGATVVEDAKGVRTKEYIIKRKLMLFVHGIKVREV